MSLAHTQISPWVSCFPQAEIQEKQESKKLPWISVLPKEKKQNFALLKMLLAVSDEAIKHFEKGEYKELDALVGNYGCEVHAFNILSLSHSMTLKQECLEMVETSKSIHQWVASQHDFPKKEFEKIIQEKVISEEMLYLIQSRLLTITKEVTYDGTKHKTRDCEKLRTVYRKLKSFDESLSNNILDKTVNIAQQNMSKLSIAFAAAKLEELKVAAEKDEEVVKRMMHETNLRTYPSKEFKTKSSSDKYPKTYSCGYYNTKALLLLIAELKSPLIIKQMIEMPVPKTFAVFKSNGKFGEFDVMTDPIECPPWSPVIVCTTYLPDDVDKEKWLETVAHHGLGNMILADASQENHYIHGLSDIKVSDSEAEQEILEQVIRAGKIGCDRTNNPLLQIDHFYCSTWGEAYP